MTRRSPGLATALVVVGMLAATALPAAAAAPPDTPRQCLVFTFSREVVKVVPAELSPNTGAPVDHYQAKINGSDVATIELGSYRVALRIPYGINRIGVRSVAASGATSAWDYQSFVTPGANTSLCDY